MALLLVMPGWLTLWIAIFADMGATFTCNIKQFTLIENQRIGSKMVVADPKKVRQLI